MSECCLLAYAGRREEAAGRGGRVGGGMTGGSGRGGGGGETGGQAAAPFLLPKVSLAQGAIATPFTHHRPNPLNHNHPLSSPRSLHFPPSAR
jgi:hypothetical protein